MSGLARQLEWAAKRNRALLDTIAQTEHAPAEQKQNAIYLEDLRESLADVKERLRKAHVMTEWERKGHTELSASKVRRALHGLGGSKGKEKFAAKQTKEEREFLERWHKEKEAQERYDGVQKALDGAEAQQMVLDRDSERNRSAKAELDKMYESIFGGPTPDVPGEDEQQEAVRKAQILLDHEEGATLPQRQALAHLQRAEQAMIKAAADMEQAWNQSRLGLFGGPTALAEANCLSASSTAQGQARRHVQAARRLQPEIAEWKPLQPGAAGDMWTETVVALSDSMQHGRVGEWSNNCKRACQELAREIMRQEMRLEGFEGRLAEARQGLEGARAELQRIRAEAFDRVPGVEDAGEGAALPPPAYS